MRLGVLRNRVAREAGVYLFGTVLNRIFPFLLLPLYTRVMSPIEFGKWGYAMALLQALFILGDLGLNAATTRLYYEQRETEDRSDFLFLGVITRIATVFCMALLLTPIMAISWGVITGHELALLPFLPLLIGCMIVQGVVSFNLASARATRNPGQFIRIQISQSVIAAAASALLVLAGWGAAGPLMGFFIGGAATAVVVGWLFVRAHPPQGRLDWSQSRTLLVYGVNFVPTAATLWLKRLADRIIIGRLLTMIDLAVYQVAASGIAPLAILLGSFNSAYLPYFFEQRRRGKGDLRKLAEIDIVIVAALAWIVTGTMMIGPELVRILAPPSYSAAASLVPPLVLTAFLGGAALQFNKEILFHKRPGIVSTVTTIPALVAVAANIYLIPRLGIAAAAWAGAGASALTLVGSIVAMRRLERTPHRFGLVFAICAITGAAALVFAWLGDMPPFVVRSLVWRGMLGALFAGAVLLAALPSILAIASMRRGAAAHLTGD